MRRSTFVMSTGVVLTAGCFALFGSASVVKSTQETRLPEDSLPSDLFHKPIPYGLPELPPLDGDSPALFDLGRSLFFDSLLSSDQSVSCATCHQPEHGFSSPEALPEGAEGRRSKRSSPSLFNRAYGTKQMWDGRAPSLHEQVLLPISDVNEMRLSLEEAMARLEASEDYPDRFAAAFGDKAVTEERLASALTSFVRRITLGDSPIDRFRAGLGAKLNAAERSGLWIFESKGQCWRCHSGPNFADELFHNTGVGLVDGKPQEGRRAVTGKDADLGTFKTPTLRGLTNTAPYMHDGSLATLKDVVEFYRDGGKPNPNLDQHLNPVDLTDKDVLNLVAFLQALSKSSPDEVPSDPGEDH